ncbi:MAG: hypothetical protein ACXWEN_12780 [Actinomycetota bacterium]
MHPFRKTLVVGSAVFMLVAAAGSALAGGNPPGNNGTVKVDGSPFEGSQANEPHVGCAFAIDFFGFDEGDLTGTATFELQPPTGNGVLLVDSTFIGEDPAGGGTDLDASLFEDLSGAIAASSFSGQPNQGFHVSLTVDAQGSIGATTKHKTFWVTDCDGEGEGGGES